MALAVVAFCCAVSQAAEFVEIEVALVDGRYYRLHDLYRQCNEKLGSGIPLETIPDRKVELTEVEQAVLLLASETGLIRARIEAESLTLSFANREDDEVRRANRRRLERLFGISLVAWPNDKGLHLPENFDPTKRTILLLHGYQSDSGVLERLRRACLASSIQPITFDYPNNGPLAWSGDRLSYELKSLAAKYPKLRLAIVAHSMGGLVARQALEAPENDPGCVTDLVMLGTPNHGSALAPLGREWLAIILQPIPTAESLRDGLGEAADDLRPGSRFLTVLNGYEPSRSVRYHVAIGRRSFFSAERRDEMRRELEVVMQRRGLPEADRAAILKYLAQPEVTDGQGDGVVAISSAQLKHMHTEKLFDSNHVELATLPGEHPERHEAFRWILATLDGDQQSENKHE